MDWSNTKGWIAFGVFLILSFIAGYYIDPPIIYKISVNRYYTPDSITIPDPPPQEQQ